MSKTLKVRAEETTANVLEILGLPADDHPKEVASAIEKAIIEALIDERHRCADMVFESYKEDAEKAKTVSEGIRAVKSVLISNLSSLR